MSLLMDTHAWVWWMTGSDRLSPRGKTAIRKAAAENRLLLSAISVWEVAKLVEKGRLRLDRDVQTWIEQALAIPGFDTGFPDAGHCLPGLFSAAAVP